jgi:hypothetical protein
MGWKHYEDKQPCPCGKDFYITYLRQNDSQRTEVISREMLCFNCRDNYEWKLVSKRNPHPGHEDVYDWVKK